MKENALCLLALGLLFAVPSKAESTQTGTVISVRVSSKTLAGGNPTHFQINGAWLNPTSCATSGWWAIDTDTPAGLSMLSVVLTAMKTGKQIAARDLSVASCTLRSDMADAKQIDFAN